MVLPIASQNLRSAECIVDLKPVLVLALLPLKIYNLETYAHEVDETYVVTIDGESIEATPEHPFYNVDGEEKTLQISK